MEWPLHRLEDLTEPNRPITYGVVKPGPEDPSNGVKFIRGGDIFEGKLAIESLRTITTEVSKSYSRTLLRGGELVVSLVGNPGHVAIIPKSLAGANLARQAGLVALRDEIDAGFVKYFLMSPNGRAELFSQMTGSVQIVINLANLRTVRVPLPPHHVQRRIAGILSAYDELIENSQRRIKILESMARALYREWFVHFRFPGHESTPRIPSPLGDIPQGWEVMEFRHIFDIRYGKTLPKTEIADCGPYPVYGAGDVIGFYDKMLCPNKCALVTSRGNGSGTVWRTREAAFVTNNSLIMLPRGDRSYWDYSFVELLLMHANVMEAKTGSAQPQVTIENLNYVKAIVPTKTLVDKFCTIVTPIYEQVDWLHRQISNLRRTRDQLLPRLLSGQIDVEALAS